jgi:catechol 2,3-dioxygenase-like lactoylglutathione lyase family enzyme
MTAVWETTEPDHAAESILWRASMLTVRSVDQPRAVRWYRNVLGFKLEYDIPIPVPVDPFRMAVLVAPDNRRLEITGRGKPKDPPTDAWTSPVTFTLQVRDGDATEKHLKEMGVEPFEVIDGQYGRLILLVDPDNNIVKLQVPNERAWDEHNLDDPNVPKYRDAPMYVPSKEA